MENEQATFNLGPRVVQQPQQGASGQQRWVLLLLPPEVLNVSQVVVVAAYRLSSEAC